jgi:hypothetical protein
MVKEKENEGYSFVFLGDFCVLIAFEAVLISKGVIPWG